MLCFIVAVPPASSSLPAPLLLHLQPELLVLFQQGDGRGHICGRLLLQETLLHQTPPALQLFGLLLEALQPASLLQEALSVCSLMLHLRDNRTGPI